MTSTCPDPVALARSVIANATREYAEVPHDKLVLASALLATCKPGRPADCDDCPDIDELRAEVERLRDALRGEIGEGAHIYQGQCPDSVEGIDSRDPICAQCARLCAALKGE